MIKFLFRYKYTLFVLLFLGTPAYIYAQAVGASGLVPCGAVSSTDYLNPNYYIQATSCNFCYFAKLIQNIVNFLVMVTIPISVAMFAWAGIKFFTAGANPKNIAQAKTIFRSVFIGFIITISGWLVVQVILQNITKSEFYNLSSWTDLQCQQMNNSRPRDKNVSDIFSPISSGTGQSAGGTGGSTGGTASVDGAAVQRAAKLLELQAACINNSTADCSLLQAICVVESGCNPQNTGCNSAGACGPMQIKPATACEANPSLHGCMVLGTRGVVLNEDAVKASLQSMSASSDTAAKIVNNASTACNGDLTCVMAYYNGGGGATKASACCSTGAAWQCQWDCGTSVARSYQCDVQQVAACKQNTGYTETRNYVPKIQAAQSALSLPTQTGGAF